MTAVLEHPLGIALGQQCAELVPAPTAENEHALAWCLGHAVDGEALCHEHLALAQAAREPGAIYGRPAPRLFTPPLRELTPATSRGFEAIQFAETVLRVALLPWQRWWLIHALEVLPSGRFRFRTVVTLVGRQSGKTTLCKILSLYMLYLGGARVVLGVAQALDIADESWNGAVELAEETDELADEVGKVIRGNGKNCLTLTSGARYRTAAASGKAGRGLSVDLLLLDELREQRDWLAWAALSKTTMARANALTVCTSNAGDDRSVVLNSLRSAALAGTDETLGVFEWSGPDGCDLDDMDAVAQACPGLGITVTEAAIRSARATDPPDVFRTEVLCQHVEALDAAIDPDGWAAGKDRGTLRDLQHRLVACLDVAPDGGHVTLLAAAVQDDQRVRTEVLRAWSDTDTARRELGPLLHRLRPRAMGYFPGGPGAIFAVELQALHGTVIGRMNVQRTEMREDAPGLLELTGGTVPALCQTLADLVAARRILHPDDPLLNAHVGGAQKLPVLDGWRFVRRGAGHVDAAYALAGAVHLARSVPPPKPPPRSKVF